MIIEIGAPAILPLGFARRKGKNGIKTVMLGVTLQHPQVHIRAAAHAKTIVLGPRAHVGQQQVTRYLQKNDLPGQVELFIETTIPGMMGFGSDESQALAIAQATAWRHDQDWENVAHVAHGVGLEPAQALEFWGYSKGGVLLVELEGHEVGGEMPALIHRHELEHPDRNAWAFVFIHPPVPTATSDTLEADRRADIMKAAQHLDEMSGHLMDEVIWKALVADDIKAFGQGLMALQKMNNDALKKAGVLPKINRNQQIMLNVLRDFGMSAFGQSLTGLGLYGLVKGATASQKIRSLLFSEITNVGGVVSATIADNVGARHVIKDGGLHDNDYKPPRLHPDAPPVS